MRSLVVLVPGDIQSRTGGYGYDRLIVAGLRGLGWSVVVHQLGDSFPHPSRAARDHVVRVLAGLPDNTLVLVDGLAFGTMAEEAECERVRLRLVALVHHPLAAETGLGADVALAFEHSERRALASVRLVVVTSHATAASLDRYGVPASRIAVVEPGTDRAAVARGSAGGPPQLLCVASVVPRKGYETLIDAMARLSSLDWRLTCVGSLDRDREYSERIRGRVEAARLSSRVLLEGELGEEAVGQRYDGADVFVLPTFYEGYGMAVAEALARGVPVVSTPVGNIPGLVGSDAGLLVSPGDPRALADAIRRVLSDPDLLHSLRAGAMRARLRMSTWDIAIRTFADALEQVVEADLESGGSLQR